MASFNFNDELNKIVNESGVTKLETFTDPRTGGPMAIRQMNGANEPLEVGDVVTIPENASAYQSDINGNPAVFTVVHVKCADGTERVARFYPNSLAKYRNPIDENRKRLPKVKTTGSVASWYADQKDVPTAIKAMEGKSFIVSSMQQVRTFVYEPNLSQIPVEERKTQMESIYEYNWAGNAPA